MSGSHPRYMVVHLPLFRLERAGWCDQDPVALIGERKNAQRVLCATSTVRRAGVRVDMTLAEARALLPALQVEPWDQHEHEDLEELALQLRRISPAVLAAPPDMVAAELVPLPGRTLADSMANERRLQDDLARHMRFLGHQMVIVVADDYFGARMLATWGGRSRCVPPGGLPGALAPLPIRALEAPARERALLESLGLRTVGDFAGLPPPAVAGRFGAWGVGAHRLICGVQPPAVIPFIPEEDSLSCSQDLPFPVASLEPLLFVLNRLVRELAALLEARGRAVVRLSLELELERGGSVPFAFRTGRPLREPRVLSRLIRHRLESLQLGAEVRSIRLHALEHVPSHGFQVGLTEQQDSQETPAELVARLADALGDASVAVPRLSDRWRPEAAWHLVPATSSQMGAGQPGADRPVPASAGDPAWVQEAWRRSFPPLRPGLLLDEPRRVQVDWGDEPWVGARAGKSMTTLSSAGGGPYRSEHGAPRRVLLDARWLTVLACRGPEHMETEWWDDPIRRTYWALLLQDGRMAWLYQESGHAYVHGWFEQGVSTSEPVELLS